MKALIFDMDGVIIDSEKVYEQADQQDVYKRQQQLSARREGI